MSSSKLTKWTKIVLTFLTVPLVFLSLLSMEKSAAGSLTSKADYSETQDYISQYRPIGTQFTQVDNYTVYCQFSLAIVSEPISWEWVNAISFNGSTTNNLQHQELEFAVIVYEYGTSNVRFESDWYPVNTKVSVSSAPQLSTDNARKNNYRVMVRRKDGSQLNRTSLNPCVCTAYSQRNVKIVYTTAIPNSWLDTTTQTVVDPLETYTTIINVSDVPDYDDLDSRLEVPHDVEVAVLHIFDVIGTIMSLKYMTFLVCFSIVMGLLVWLLH